MKATLVNPTDGNETYNSIIKNITYDPHVAPMLLEHCQDLYDIFFIVHFEHCRLRYLMKFVVGPYTLNLATKQTHHTTHR
jgi:hypothetical protein